MMDSFSITTIPVGALPRHVTVAPNGGDVYVTYNFSTTADFWTKVSVIDTTVNAIVTTIPLDVSAGFVTVTPDGGRLYVTSFESHKVSVIDVITSALVTTIPLASNNLPLSPMALAVTPDGAYVYVANLDGPVSVIDTTTNVVVSTITRTLGGAVLGATVDVAVAPDGGRVYVTDITLNNLWVIDTSTNSVVTAIPVGTRPNRVALAPDGRRGYVIHEYDSTNDPSNAVWVIDTTTNAVVTLTSIIAGPTGVAVAPDGGYVYVTTSDHAVLVIDTTTNAVVTSIPLGRNTGPQDVAASSQNLYVANFSSNTVSVITSVPSGWTSVSQGSTTPGAPVTAVPWGTAGRLALFIADPNGGIYTTGGWPPGNWGPWAIVSDPFRTTPGAAVTAVPWGERFILFVTNSNGEVHTTEGNPDAPFEQWVSVSQGSTTPGTAVTAVPWGTAGRLALFIADPNGGIYTTGGWPPGNWGPWAIVSDPFRTTPGASVTAVPWGERFILFVTNSNGEVHTTEGNPDAPFEQWVSVAQGSTTPGARITALPWGNELALFITDPNGGIYTTLWNPQTKVGYWSYVPGISAKPGSPVTAVPWGERFALLVADSNGGIYMTEGDPQQGFGPWMYGAGITVTSGSRVAAVPFGDGLVLFVTDINGRIFTLEREITTGFTAKQNGWHFNNGFVNQVIGSLLETKGLCGGMAYSSLDYYFADLPIPTHRKGDFGDPNAEVPPDGRLRTMIFNRLIDSFKDNFGKWSCIYPELDVAIGAALGIVVGAGIVGGVIGAVGGFIYGEVRNVFECPRGGAAGMTRRELPILTRNFLDKGIPVPIGLIYDEDILHIGASHQVVAYGYSMSGTTMIINIYDNRYPDVEHTLTLDASNPGRISHSDGDSWAGLLVEDGYRPQWPSYGPDISIESPQSIQLNGIPTKPIIDSRAGLARSVKISMVPQQQVGSTLVDSYSVKNCGEFAAHYVSLGIEVQAPDGSQSFVLAPAPAAETQLSPGESTAVTITVPNFGSAPGVYTLFVGINSVGVGGVGVAAWWCRILYPPASVTIV